MASHYSLERRFSLVSDCYKSVFSILSWCKEKGIAPGTFYGWINQVANKGYDVPAFKGHGTAHKQEIVEVSTVDIPSTIDQTLLSKILRV